MHNEELDRLNIILRKEPIVGTFTAQDFLDIPEVVQDNYLKHVRSFVVLGRVKASADDHAITVAEYEKHLIKLVKDKGAAKGYITADYGYGKTSTALFLWNRCQESNLLAVPPFQIQKLEQLLTATYGWVYFILNRNYPHLAVKAKDIYQRYITNDINTQSENEEVRQALRQMYEEGRLTLKLRDIDYIRFFEEMTRLVQEAHYDGLVVIADELQQYLETHRAQGDPLAALFGIIQALITRKNQLAFGLIFSVTIKDLGFMNDFRGDLVQRLKSDGLALDLKLIYNQTFARELWHQLSKELQFEHLQDRIVKPETLEALGQISARSDLSSGPRTVINAFQVMVRHYQDKNKYFSPIDLVDAFLNGDVSYDNTGYLRQVVNDHLNNQFVRANASYQKAIKLIAAFPQDGLDERTMDIYETRQAVEGLTRIGRGDIITFVGNRYDERGFERGLCAMLVGLEARQVNTDWLAMTIREFIQNYNEHVPQIRELMVEGFEKILKTHIFKEGSWKLLHSFSATMSQNRSLIWSGAFASTRKNFPERRLHVRILQENELVKDTAINGDLALNFELQTHLSHEETTRRDIPGTISSTEKTITYSLNLSHYGKGEHDDSLTPTLGQAVAPWQMTPALLLSFHSYLDRKRETRVIPAEDDEQIRSIYQPLLLDRALQELFNQELGTVVKANGERIVEETVRNQLGVIYPDYRTLISGTQWRNNLREYRNALQKLPSIAERQGRQPFVGKRSDLANLLGRTVPAVESFLTINSLLIKNEKERWYFLLHPLEEKLLAQIKRSVLTDTTRRGSPRAYITSDAVRKQANRAGYRDEEVNEVISLLEVRGLITLDTKRTRLYEEVIRIPQVRELRVMLDGYLRDLRLFLQTFPDDIQLANWLKEMERYYPFLDNWARTPDEQRQNALAVLIHKRQGELVDWAASVRSRLFNEIRVLVQGFQGKSFDTSNLEKSVGEGLFAAQLDTQRQQLMHSLTAVTAKIESLREQTVEMLRAFNQDTGPGDELITMAEQLQRVRKDARHPQEQLGQLSGYVHSYNQVRQLLSQAQNLEYALRQLPEQLAETTQAKLNKWALRITSEFSSSKLNALKKVEDWREQFELIEQEFREKISSEDRRFQSIQSDYRDFLLQRFPQLTQWTPIVFNASQPKDSYDRLWQDVHKMLKDAVMYAHVHVKRMHDRAVRLGGGLENLPPSERAEVREIVNNLYEQLQQRLETTNTWLENISRPEFIDPVIEHGMQEPAEIVLKNVVTNITNLTEILPQIGRAIEALERKVSAALLSTEESQVIAILSEMFQGKEHSGEYELGLLLNRLNGSPQEKWQSIASLYSKQRLSIKVSLISYDE